MFTSQTSDPPPLWHRIWGKIKQMRIWMEIWQLAERTLAGYSSSKICLGVERGYERRHRRQGESKQEQCQWSETVRLCEWQLDVEDCLFSQWEEEEMCSKLSNSNRKKVKGWGLALIHVGWEEVEGWGRWEIHVQSSAHAGICCIAAQHWCI